MKKILSIIALMLVLALALGACSAPAEEAPAAEAPAAEAPAEAPAEEAPATEEAPAETGEAAPATEVSGDSIQAPMIVTTCGQSPGAVMVNMVAVQSGFTSASDNSLTAETLDTSAYKTLVVTAGTSMKGMGAAGTDVDTEIERCTALMQAAKDAGRVVVGAPIEGMARRTDNSDEKSIEAVMGMADVILVVEDSDSDGFFTDYAAQNNKPLIKVSEALDIASVITE